TPRFATVRAGRVRPARLFAGGPGGPARLAQTVALRAVGGGRLPANTRYHLSAWLGGDAKSAGSVTVRFLSPSGRRLGRVTIGPVGGGTPNGAARGKSGHRPRAGLRRIVRPRPLPPPP